MPYVAIETIAGGAEETHNSSSRKAGKRFHIPRTTIATEVTAPHLATDKKQEQESHTHDIEIGTFPAAEGFHEIDKTEKSSQGSK